MYSNKLYANIVETISPTFAVIDTVKEKACASMKGMSEAKELSSHTCK